MLFTTTKTTTTALVAALLVAGCGDDAGSDTGSSESGDEVDASSGDTSDTGETAEGQDTGDTGDTGDSSDTGDGDSACASGWDQVEKKGFAQSHAGYGVAIASDGNFVVVGKLENADDDGWIGMFDPSGAAIWSQVVDGGAGKDYAQAVTFDAAGDVALVGSQRSADKALWVEKRAAGDGALLWSVLDPPQFAGDNLPGDIALAPDGALLVSATLRAGDQDSDIAVRKLASADGSTLWTASWSGAPDPNGFSIDRAGPIGVAPDGAAVVGGTEGVDADTKEGVVLRFGSEGGAPQWRLAPRADAGNHLHEVTALTVGPDGEAYFALYQSGGLWAFWVYRASDAGSVEWELASDAFVFEPTDEWLVTDMAMAADGTLTVGGRLLDEEVGQSITWSEAWLATIGLDGAGECLTSHTWQNAHIIPASTFAYAFAEGPSGAIAVGEIIDGPENYFWFGGFD